MKYIRKYENEQAFNDDQPATIAYRDIEGHRGLVKDGDVYKGTFNNLPFQIENLETLYIFDSPLPGATEIIAHEIVITGTPEEISTRSWGTLTATGATINGGPISISYRNEYFDVDGGWVYKEDTGGDNFVYKFFFTCNYYSPARIDYCSNDILVYVLEEEMIYNPDVKAAMCVIERYGNVFQTESFEMNDQGQVLLAHAWGEPDPIIINYHGPGQYYIQGGQEKSGKYEQGTELKVGITRRYGAVERHEGYVMTHADDPTKQYLKVEQWQDHYNYYPIAGMDSEDPTAYALSTSYVSYGWTYLIESRDITYNEPFKKETPGVAYDTAKVHYNKKLIDVKGEGLLTWEELGITDSLFNKWVSLFKKRNVMGLEYGFTFIGTPSMSREMNSDDEITFYESYTTNGDSSMCGGFGARVNRQERTVYVWELQCV